MTPQKLYLGMVTEHQVRQASSQDSIRATDVPKQQSSSVGPILHMLLLAQADRRALNITLNSIGTELTRDDRRKLYSNFGLLYPHGHHELASAEDFDAIRNAMEKCPPYQALFNKLGYGESQMLDKVSLPAAVALCVKRSCAGLQMLCIGMGHCLLTYKMLLLQPRPAALWALLCVHLLCISGAWAREGSALPGL